MLLSCLLNYTFIENVKLAWKCVVKWVIKLNFNDKKFLRTLQFFFMLVLFPDLNWYFDWYIKNDSKPNNFYIPGYN